MSRITPATAAPARAVGQAAVGFLLASVGILLYIPAMKLSVSVPDDLWELAQSSAPEESSPSALVQEALRHWTTGNSVLPGVAAQRPAEYDKAFEQLQARMAAEAQAEAQRGYVAALSVAERLEWRQLDDLAERYKFDVAKWANAWRKAAEEADYAKAGLSTGWGEREWSEANTQLLQSLMTALGNLASPHDMKEWVPSPTYIRGFRQALLELWRRITAGGAWT